MVLPVAEATRIPVLINVPPAARLELALFTHRAVAAPPVIFPPVVKVPLLNIVSPAAIEMSPEAFVRFVPAVMR